jgi:hypothetical protein
MTAAGVSISTATFGPVTTARFADLRSGIIGAGFIGQVHGRATGTRVGSSARYPMYRPKASTPWQLEWEHSPAHRRPRRSSSRRKWMLCISARPTTHTPNSPARQSPQEDT